MAVTALPSSLKFGIGQLCGIFILSEEPFLPPHLTSTQVRYHTQVG